MKTYTKIKLAKFIYNFLIFFRLKKDLTVRRNLINWKLDLSEGIDLSIFLIGSFQGKVVESIIKYIFNQKKKILLKN